MGLRSSIGANEQYVRNIQDAQGWMDSTESALDSITALRQPRARRCCCRAPPTPPTPTSRNAIATEIDQIIQGIKETANASYGDKYIMSRHGDLGRRRTSSAPTTPTRATRPAWTRRSPASCARSAPA